VSLRYFNVYGKRQSAMSDYSGVISIFEKKFKNDEIPNIYGDGEQYRDFVYVKDVAKANIKAMNTPNISGELFCVGASRKVSINDLVSVLNHKYSKKMRANYLDARNGDIKESICDNKKIKQFLDFDEFMKFEEGVLKL
jgi:UDP-glucose 4-epimerase